MYITNDELKARGFVHGGTVHPDRTPLRCVNPGSKRERWEGLFVVENWWNVDGFAVYLMVVNGEVKKAGQTGKGNSNFKTRMESSFNCLRPVIAAGPPYQGDPFKRYASVAMVEGRKVELWVKKESTLESMVAEEAELNEHYRGEWTKEGWSSNGTRR